MKITWVTPADRNLSTALDCAAESVWPARAIAMICRSRKNPRAFFTWAQLTSVQVTYADATAPGGAVETTTPIA